MSTMLFKSERSKIEKFIEISKYTDDAFWVKVLRGLFSFISLIIFLFELLSAEHNVQGFFSSLLLSSSSVFIDLLIICDSFSKNDMVEEGTKKLFYSALTSSAVCFGGSLTIILLGLGNISGLNAFLSGEGWQFAFFSFPLAIFSFVIDIFRPIKPIDPGILTEDRPITEKNQKGGEQ